MIFFYQLIFKLFFQFLGESGFLVDESTGLIQTNQSYGKYADGFFDVIVKASNSLDPAKADFAFVKVQFLN